MSLNIILCKHCITGAVSTYKYDDEAVHTIGAWRPVTRSARALTSHHVVAQYSIVYDSIAPYIILYCVIVWHTMYVISCYDIYYHISTPWDFREAAAVRTLPLPRGRRQGSGARIRGEIVYTSRSVRVILAQGPR